MKALFPRPKDDDPFRKGSPYDTSFRNALNEVVPRYLDDTAALTVPQKYLGTWFVEILWDRDSSGEWIQSYAHHIAHPQFNNGFRSLEEAFRWASRKYPNILCHEADFFRMRFVFSTDGPPKGTKSRIEYFDLGPK